MQSDPFEYLMTAGSHSNTWFLVVGPLLILMLVLIVAAAYVRVLRRKTDQAISSETKEDLVAAKKDVALPAAEAELIATDVQEIRSQDRNTWLTRLRGGLARTRDSLTGGLAGIFSGASRIDEETLERIHEVLYRADVGVKTADRLVEAIRNDLAGQTVEWTKVTESLSRRAEGIFSEAVKPLNTPAEGLFVVLVVGVNGVGKTTTIGKLAARFTAEGKKVMLCAADTFRAAAIDQLMVWGERNHVPVIKQHQGADPAAVAFDGVQAAKARGMDVLIIDTAGRLHNKNELMAELSKINKSIGKGLPQAPHETWIVVDATTGQNAVQQVKAFSEVTQVTGIVVTKLDGTAKGGVIIGIADQFKIPIRYIGVGEKAADLRAFESSEFMRGLLGT
jgi:fused signal recognition particle receptor